jgi:CMP/dCMP kinase
MALSPKTTRSRATYRALTLALLRQGVPPDDPEAVAAAAKSAVPAVREQLVALQRAVIGLGGVVAEGRDIGTVVWPQAEVKVFLTADAAERARRRGGPGTAGESAEAVARRDRLDSGRAASPTRAAPDALVIDSTNRAADDVVDQIVGLVEAARAGRSR